MAIPQQRLAILADPSAPGAYFVFDKGSLRRVQDGDVEVVTELPMINETAHGISDGRLEGKPLSIRMYVRGSWVVVTERYGVNAALVNTTTGTVRSLAREDYYAAVSSYSIGLIERDSRILLIAQTAWNRLDVLDAETGANLTEREVSIRDNGLVDEKGFKVYDKVNYVDYFHSLLHVSPDSRHFLSNGWVWSPFDQVRAFNVEAFLTRFDPSGAIAALPGGGYNWDRPGTFIDNDTFVLAVDDNTDALDRDEIAAYSYHQLAYFSVSGLAAGSVERRYLEPTDVVACDIFPLNSHNEVKGELHFDKTSGCLVALTESEGTYIVSLSGEIVHHMPEVSLGTTPAHNDVGSSPGDQDGWAYSVEHRTFYRWAGGVEEVPLPDSSQWVTGGHRD